MIPRRITFLAAPSLLLLVAGCAGAPQGSALRPVLPPPGAASPPQTFRIHASRLLDGRGRVLRDVNVVIAGDRIQAVEPGPADGAAYDLSRFTVLPGLIDVHVHMDMHFTAKGRLNTDGDGETPAQAQQRIAENVRATLRAGFTTVQSPGDPGDARLREAIARWDIEGPRLLTSLEPVGDDGGGPDRDLKGAVDDRKAHGADLIKVFASKSIREGGAPTLSQEQLDSVCGEARAVGLRAIVHAHSAEAIRRAVKAGCTQIEHGVFADDETLRMMAERGVYFDPQCSLIFRNYLDNRPKFFGIGNYNEEGFAAMERALPLAVATVRRALATPGLKVVFGTDAVAGAHGRNAEDLICRIQQAGEEPMDALLSATSRAAASLGLGDRVGAVAPGMSADLVALDGDPLADATAYRRVVFVMKAGRAVVTPSSGARPIQ